MKIQVSIAYRALVLLASLALLPACSKFSNPTNPVASTFSANPTPAPVTSAGVSEIYWYIADLSRNGDSGSPNTYAEIYLSVGGQAETTAVVVLSAANASVTLPYVSTLTLGPTSYAHYYLGGDSVQYQPGTKYTLSTQTSAGTAWASVVAPGGIQCAADGSSVTWQSEGNKDRVYVQDSLYNVTFDSLDTQADVDSAFSVPGSAFPSAGTYYVRAVCNSLVSSVNNAIAGSSLEAIDMSLTTVTK